MPDPSRRSLLMGGAITLGVGLAGCSPSELPIINRPDPDKEHRISTAKSEQDLIGLYSAVIEEHPELARKLKPIRKHHLEHLEAVISGVEFSGSPSKPPNVNDKPSNALNQLVRAERSAARARTEASVVIDDGDLARLVAQIGSSESSHQAFLTRTSR